MSTTPAGWYPDPEHEGATRYWDGQAWAPTLPVKTGSAAKRLGGFAIASAAIAVIAMGSFMFMGAAFLGIAALFGMPDAGSVAIEGIKRWCATGAVYGLAFALIGLVLAIIATTRNPRPRTRLLAPMWSIVGFALLAELSFLTSAEPIFL